MSKSKSHPCTHPRTAVSADIPVGAPANTIEYRCKKCGKVWREDQPDLLQEPDGSPVGASRGFGLTLTPLLHFRAGIKKPRRS